MREEDLPKPVRLILSYSPHYMGCILCSERLHYSLVIYYVDSTTLLCSIHYRNPIVLSCYEIRKHHLQKVVWTPTIILYALIHIRRLPAILAGPRILCPL